MVNTDTFKHSCYLVFVCLFASSHFEIRSHYIIQAGLRATVALLLQPPKCWGNGHEIACIVLSVEKVQRFYKV